MGLVVSFNINSIVELRSTKLVFEVDQKFKLFDAINQNYQNQTYVMIGKDVILVDY